MEQEGPEIAVPEFSPRPQQMMAFADALTSVFRNNYGNFNGRASRSEYWWSFLAIFLYGLVFQFVIIAAVIVVPDLSGAIFGLGIIVYLGLIIPALTVAVRRLHDTGKTGWLYLVLIVPCIGTILWIVWAVEDGQAHVNAYGPVPTNKLE